MSRHWLKMNEESDANSNQEANQRHALESMPADGADFADIASSSRRQRQACARAQSIQKANAHKPVFTIYEDPAGHEVDFFDSSADWRTLDTRRHQNKENEVAAGKWNQPIARQNSAIASLEPVAGSRRAPVEPLQVFVDEEFSASQPTKPELNAHMTARSCTLRQRIEGASTEEEMLAKKPLKNFGQKEEDNRDQIDVSKPSKKPRHAKDIKSEKLGYDLEMMKTDSGELLSFEELRARAHTSRSKPHSRPTAPRQHNRFVAADSSTAGQSSYHEQRVNSFLDASAAANTSVRADAIARKLSFATSTKKLSPRRQAIPAARMASLDHAAQEDMTINTRVAMSEVNDMFCSPEREAEAKVWDIREEDPVERKLHFSVFDDSVDSVAPSLHEQSVREDANNSFLKQSFQIFADDVAVAPQTETKGKSQQRKPLGSRDDLLRSVRLTNKDVLMQLRTEKLKDTTMSSDVKR